VPDYTASLIGDIDAVRVGIPQPYFFAALQPCVRDAVSQAVEQLAQLGGHVEEQTLTTLDAAPEVLWTLISGDAGVVHEAHLVAHADILDTDVRRLAELGATMEAKAYVKAQQARDAITHEMAEALERVDVWVTPTAPIVSPPLGDDTVAIGGDMVPMRPMLRRLTLPFNLSGFPVCTLPCGMSPEGLPIGLQIVGKPFDEAMVLRVAHAYERSTHWHQRHPGTP
jgi:aspartyl-tRNA(Asn)/glutamyl-tRNA(Gln) amidotransferase subunit A